MYVCTCVLLAFLSQQLMTKLLADICSGQKHYEPHGCDSAACSERKDLLSRETRIRLQQVIVPAYLYERQFLTCTFASLLVCINVRTSRKTTS